jgi:hypothetical protein
MELKDFIKETLCDIIRGLREAQEVEGVGSFISPRGAGGGRQQPARAHFPENRGVSQSSDGQITTTVIEFDLAVAAESSQTESGKGELKVAVLNAGIEGETTNKNAAANRVKFAIPVALPQSPRHWDQER